MEKIRNPTIPLTTKSAPPVSESLNLRSKQEVSASSSKGSLRYEFIIVQMQDVAIFGMPALNQHLQTPATEACYRIYALYFKEYDQKIRRDNLLAKTYLVPSHHDSLRTSETNLPTYSTYINQNKLLATNQGKPKVSGKVAQ